MTKYVKVNDIETCDEIWVIKITVTKYIVKMISVPGKTHMKNMKWEGK